MDLRLDLLPWLQALYLGSGVLLLGISIYASQQVRILKRDMRIRNERAAKEKAIEYARRYLNDYVALSAKVHEVQMEHEIPDYDGPVSDFTIGSIPIEELDKAKRRVGKLNWLASVNELQSISAAFVSGVADEQLGFEIIGRTFCRTVESNYDILTYMRSDNIYPYFDAIVKLYFIWSPRLERAELSEKHRRLVDRIDNLGDHRVSPIGTEE